LKSNQAEDRGSLLGRIPRLTAEGVVDLYAVVVSPLVMALFGPGCRFEPSCSQYARGAIVTHGLVRGAAMAAARIARCHPLGGHGFDPVPLASAAKEKSKPKGQAESQARESPALALGTVWRRPWQSR
jgi:hypothetical protein